MIMLHFIKRIHWHLFGMALFIVCTALITDFRNNTGVPWSVTRATLFDLLSNETPERLSAIRRIAQTKEPRAAPFLILSWSLEVAGSDVSLEIEKALRHISDKNLGPDWRYWYLEYWGQALPAEFENFVFELYLARLPFTREFLSKSTPKSIPMSRVLWGGIAKDGIPPLHFPKIISVAAATYLDSDEMVFGAFVNGEARAYPLRIMDWHEMLNDAIAGVPIVLSYCPLCGSASLYDRHIDSERVALFGTSGLLYQSNKLMYDDQTQNLWSNMLGKPVIGSLLATKRTYTLQRLPLTQTTWGEWKKLHPATQVLALPTALVSRRTGRARIQTENRTYEPGSAYSEYRTTKDLLFPTVVTDKRLEPKAWVYGLIISDQARAYPLQKLIEQSIVNDKSNGRTLVLIANAESSVHDYWQHGGTIRAYERKNHSFRRNADGHLVDERGHVWKLYEQELTNLFTGESLARLEGQKAYWFGWVSFHPETELWTP